MWFADQENRAHISPSWRESDRTKITYAIIEIILRNNTTEHT